MINQKYYCNVCDKDFVNKNSHNKTKLHTELSLNVVNKYYINDISVNEINSIINKHIYDYKKIFRNVDCWCITRNEFFRGKIKVICKYVTDNIKIQEEIIRRYKCSQDDLFCVEIVFVTDLKSATHNHYFKLRRPMIERKICQTINRNPNLIKLLDHMLQPYKRQIIIKHWGIRYEDHNEKIYIIVPNNWMDLEPNIINYTYFVFSYI